MDGDLLAIGRFGRLTGLTVATLRHWDAEGLLHPAAVDPHTGYRRYRADQEPAARAIAALRDLDLPVLRGMTPFGAVPGGAKAPVELPSSPASPPSAAHTQEIAVPTPPLPPPPRAGGSNADTGR